MKLNPFILSLLILVLSGNISAQSPYTIYPVPQEYTLTSGKASFTHSVDVVAEAGIDRYTLDRVEQILQERLPLHMRLLP